MPSKGTAKYTVPLNDVEGGATPVNSLSRTGWNVTFCFTFLTWGASIATIGLAANAFVRWKQLRNRVQNEAAQNGVQLELISPDLEPAGITILVLSSFICVITSIMLIHLVFHRPSTKKPAHRGLSGVPTFYFAMGPLLFVLTWLVFGNILAYTYFYGTGSIMVRGTLPDGIAIASNQISSLQISVVNFSYTNFNFLEWVVGIAWLLWLLCLILSVALWFAGCDAILEPIWLEKKPRAVQVETHRNQDPAHPNGEEVVTEAKEPAEGALVDGARDDAVAHPDAVSGVPQEADITNTADNAPATPQNPASTAA